LKIISITLMGICLADPAQAQNIDFDIFDVRIGDSAAMASKALATKGFEPKGELRGPSFEERLGVRRKEINEFEARGAVKELQFSRGADKVTLKFTVWPDGEKVSSLFYRPNMTYDDCPRFVASAREKYKTGIEYANSWIDRPVEKNGLSIGHSPGTISVQVRCTRGSRDLTMSSFSPETIQREMLDRADVKPKNDF